MFNSLTELFSFVLVCVNFKDFFFVCVMSIMGWYFYKYRHVFGVKNYL